MGTRHLICVVINKKYKVAQYGQWDGYPEGQGKNVLRFLNNVNLDNFKKAVKQTKFVSDKKVEKAYNEVEEYVKVISGDSGLKVSDKFSEKYPAFSRDTCSDILHHIMFKDVRELQNMISFAKDSLYCEWCYVIDFDKGKFEVYKGFNTDPKDRKGRFGKLRPIKNNIDTKYYPVTLLTEYDLSKLPEEDRFISHIEELMREKYPEDYKDKNN